MQATRNKHYETVEQVAQAPVKSYVVIPNLEFFFYALKLYLGYEVHCSEGLKVNLDPLV